MKSKVYFTRELTPEAVVKLYHALGATLPGKVAVKIHSGEKGNQNSPSDICHVSVCCLCHL